MRNTASLSRFLIISLYSLYGQMLRPTIFLFGNRRSPIIRILIGTEDTLPIAWSASHHCHHSFTRANLLYIGINASFSLCSRV